MGSAEELSASGQNTGQPAQAQATPEQYHTLGKKPGYTTSLVSASGCAQQTIHTHLRQGCRHLIHHHHATLAPGHISKAHPCSNILCRQLHPASSSCCSSWSGKGQSGREIGPVRSAVGAPCGCLGQGTLRAACGPIMAGCPVMHVRQLCYSHLTLLGVLCCWTAHLSGSALLLTLAGTAGCVEGPALAVTCRRR